MTSHNADKAPNIQRHFAAANCNKRDKKRIAPLSVRLTQDQRTRLEQDAVGMSLNAYVISCLFDDPDAKAKRRRKSKQPSKRDKALASALMRLSQVGIASYLASQIIAFEEGEIDLNEQEEYELRVAYDELYRIRSDLMEAMGLKVE